MDPLVFIVVLNYRNYEDTIECVRSIGRIDYRNLRVVIVDNASGNGSEERLRQAFPDHQVVQSGENRGFASGNNVGIRIAMDQGADYVLVLNNDTILEPNCVSILVAYAEQDALAGVMSPQLVDSEGQHDPTCTRRRPTLRELFWNDGIWTNRKLQGRVRYGAAYTLDGPSEVEVISGACMLFRRSLVEEIGLLDESTFLYWEEFILCEKLRATGFRTALVPAARVVHKGGRSVRYIGARSIGAYLQSLAHYLKRYRKVGVFRSSLILLSTSCVQLPTLIKSAVGLRKLEHWFRSRRLREGPSPPAD